MSAPSPSGQGSNLHKDAGAGATASCSRGTTGNAFHNCSLTKQQNVTGSQGSHADTEDEISTTDGGLSFGDLFFCDRECCDGVQDPVCNAGMGEGDVSQPTSFDVFCFDYLYNNETTWPTAAPGGTNLSPKCIKVTPKEDGVTPFEFLLDGAATDPSAEELCMDLGFDTTMPPNAHAVGPVPLTKTSEGSCGEPLRNQSEHGTEGACVASFQLTKECAPAAPEVRECSVPHSSTSGDNCTGNTCIPNDALRTTNFAGPRLNKSSDHPLASRPSKEKPGPGASGPNGAGSTVHREGVEELLRRAERILRVEVAGQGIPVASYTTNSSGALSAGAAQVVSASGGSSDAFFSAQVSHWLRRGEELHECALAAISGLQLQATRALQMFGAHPSLSSTLGLQYANTPVVLTLPLVPPLVNSLLEEE